MARAHEPGGSQEDAPNTDLADHAGIAVEVFEEPLDAEMRIQEAMMLGLRTREGVDVAALEARVGKDPLASPARSEAVERRQASGDLTLQDGVLRVPTSRWLMPACLHSILASSGRTMLPLR